MMTTEMQKKALSLLIKHEDDRKRAYLDTAGNITVGIGHNLSNRDVADDIRFRWAKEDIGEFYNHLSQTFPWYNKLTPERQIALIDMAFMGWQHFLTFQKMIDCLSVNDFKGAALEILNSEYRREVGQRAIDIANIISQGVINV